MFGKAIRQQCRVDIRDGLWALNWKGWMSSMSTTEQRWRMKFGTSSSKLVHCFNSKCHPWLLTIFQHLWKRPFLTSIKKWIWSQTPIISSTGNTEAIDVRQSIRDVSLGLYTLIKMGLREFSGSESVNLLRKLLNRASSNETIF